MIGEVYGHVGMVPMRVNRGQRRRLDTLLLVLHCFFETWFFIVPEACLVASKTPSLLPVIPPRAGVTGVHTAMPRFYVDLGIQIQDLVLVQVV